MKKLLLGAVVLSALVIASCKNSGGGDPKSVLTSFFDALTKKDIAAARKLATPESKSMLDMMEMGMKMGGDKKEDDKYNKDKVEFGEPKIEGDKATIAVKDKGTSESTTFTLKKVSGEWKVAFDKESMMNMGMEKAKEKGMDNDSTINAGMEKIKNMNMDSLKDKVDESMKKLEELKKANQ